MTHGMRAVFLLLACVATLAAQEYIGARREFLTDHEIEAIREAQDPNLRIQRYLEFAKLRIELLRRRLAEEKPGRSQIIHRTLKEYGHILEAVDTVVDDALDRDFDISPTIGPLLARQETFLAALEKIADDPPQDHFRYQFVLADAIDITRDSMALAGGDLGARKAAIQEADEQEVSKREASMVPELKKELEEIRREEQKKKT